jgi:putative NADPH-quinone reductase
MSKVMVVIGHPQRNTFCEALGKAYADGARSGGHEVRLFILPDMTFDRNLRDGYPGALALVPEVGVAFGRLAARDHVVIVFPLWCGDMPALLKGFIERILQPDLIARQGSNNEMNWHIFHDKSARIVMTMGMPVSIYRWWYRGHALKLLTRNILHFIGIKPVRSTLYGMIGMSKPEQRERWLAEMRQLGRAAQ